MCDRHVLNRYNIRTYFRFKDDLLLVVGGNKSSRREWLGQFRSRATPFIIKVESVAAWSVDVLDITMFKGPGWRQTGRLDIKPFIKVSKLGIPLCSKS